MFFVAMLACFFSSCDSNSNENELHYTWNEGEIFEIQNQDQYDWVTQQSNVLVIFIRSENYDVDPYLSAASTVTNSNLPWLWLAKVGYDTAPKVFSYADVTVAPTIKFFSYGVEMSELSFDGYDVTEDNITISAQVLIDRYESEVLHPETYEEFIEMLEDNSTPVLVKFGAFWCPPCNYMVPRLELASIQYGDELLDENYEYIRDEKLITIIEVETTVIQGLGDQFGFESIPFFIFYNDGVRYGDMLGSRTYDQLEDEINEFLEFVD